LPEQQTRHWHAPLLALNYSVEMERFFLLLPALPHTQQVAIPAFTMLKKL
jgi:hypothetical protein